jgi:biotin carboxyl carrier protein
MTETADEAEKLLELMARHGMGAFEYRDGTRSLRIVNGHVQEDEVSAGLPVPQAEPQAVPSPAVGRFRAADGPLPRTVARGEIIGFVGSGSLRLPVVAPAEGVLQAARHADDTAVGYDTPLFDFIPEI